MADEDDRRGRPHAEGRGHTPAGQRGAPGPVEALNVPAPEQRAVLPCGLRSTLRCPLSGDELVDGLDEAGRPTLVSRSAHLAYPVRDGVPILLIHEASRVTAPGPAPRG